MEGLVQGGPQTVRDAVWMELRQARVAGLDNLEPGQGVVGTPVMCVVN